MKKLITLLVFSASLMVGCEEPLCITGSGQVAQYDLDVSSFDKISVSGPVYLNLSQGAVQHVSVVAQPEMFAALEYNVQNNRLDIGYENVRCFNTRAGVNINITIPDIIDITFDGAGRIQSVGTLDLSELGIRTSGDVILTLSGNCPTLEINAEGSLVVQNYELSTERTYINIQGSAEAALTCTQQLDIVVDGKAKVSYKGQPQISENVKGNLELINAN